MYVTVFSALSLFGVKVAGYRAVIVRSWRAPRARRSIAISRLSKSGYF